MSSATAGSIEKKRPVVWFGRHCADRESTFRKLRPRRRHHFGRAMAPRCTRFTTQVPKKRAIIAGKDATPFDRRLHQCRATAWHEGTAMGWSGRAAACDPGPISARKSLIRTPEIPKRSR